MHISSQYLKPYFAPDVTQRWEGADDDAGTELLTI